MAKMPKQKSNISKQAVGTPKELIEAVERRFGPIVLDLAAHAGNHIIEHYIGPIVLELVYDPNPKYGRNDPDQLIAELVEGGADFIEAKYQVYTAINGNVKTKISVPNWDTKCFAKNSLAQDWTKLLAGGLGWLNCEFNNIEPWAKKCWEEAQKGARIILLTPLTVANWAVNYCHGKGLVLGLNPRIIFKDHTSPYPKDIQLTCYNLGSYEFEPWRWKD